MTQEDIRALRRREHVSQAVFAIHLNVSKGVVSLIVLLCGGDKGTQRRDIDTAHRILSEWRKQNG